MFPTLFLMLKKIKNAFYSQKNRIFVRWKLTTENWNIMASLKNIWNKAKPILLNKYLLLLIGFAVLITFIGEYNLIKRWQTTRNIKQLEREIVFYKNEIETNLEKMKELQSSNENLEKFAREQYLMKRPNEDIFIVSE